MTFIDACLRQGGFHLFSTYRILEEAERTFDHKSPPYNKIKSKRKTATTLPHTDLAAVILSMGNRPQADVLRELYAARRLRKKADLEREEEREREREEEANLLKAQAEGAMMDCQCCFGDYPVNRMVHCNSESDAHWFCRGCARQTAETVIGQSKYQLVCMAMGGCTSSFSIEQR
jgi:TRIAD3 protein (E3 ubiquitin-protein ligase RNF216)